MDNSVIIANNAQRTSIAAAEKVLPRTGSLKRKVYEYILKQGLRGSTDYEIEKTFVEESMPDGLQGMTKNDMVRYVQYVTDIVLNDFGCDVEFNVTNPLDYMARIGLSAKNNFFEKRDGEYTRVEIPTTTEGMFDEDF